MKKHLSQLLALIATLYAATSCTLYTQQENLLFHPTQHPAHYA